VGRHGVHGGDRGVHARRGRLVYLPIPLAGLFTLLFIVEKVWVGEPPATSVMYRDQPMEAE
jgi:hypothetical protein